MKKKLIMLEKEWEALCNKKGEVVGVIIYPKDINEPTILMSIKEWTEADQQVLLG